MAGLIKASPIDHAIPTILLAATFPILLIRGRLKLDPKDPFRLYVGDDSTDLAHVTGVSRAPPSWPTSTAAAVSSADPASPPTRRNVYGGGGGGVIKPTETTILDQFFIRRADGYVAPIKLQGWDIAVTDGHLASAVWATKGVDSNPFVAVRNHTTRGWAMSPKSPPFSIARRNPIVLFTVLLLVACSPRISPWNCPQTPERPSTSTWPAPLA